MEAVQMTTPQADVVEDVIMERVRQDSLFGQQNHHPAYWLALLGKQQGQLGEAVVDREWAADKVKAMDKIRHEAVQMIAVGVAMVEAIDRGELPETLVTSQPANPRQRAVALGRGDEQLNYDV